LFPPGIYKKAFAGIEEIQIPTCRKNVQHAWHLFVIQLNLERLKINRSQFIEALREKEIGTSVHFIPLHLHPYYRDTFGYKPGDFPNASAVFERIVSLPIYPAMSESDVGKVAGAVRDIARQYRR
jgi:dTDP-4-amino-4,6-dideoxygalactose transaminase